ncbi:hypothetical protein GSQ33_05075 [Clostridioides difficile]|uniref:hypothetical protein n=1 Tax=Clostridioides difficile TaxID=1496 RepID=UPI000C9A45F6|nr:hypothetical protein [Clostridioides difficile]MCB4304451.1 hypothetical protein [Clostridioides difficile]MCM0736475.1 hypothetical protein [Clostridioides difficile]MCM0740537.1 hypothetical protein [Clostridioides difficile]MCM0744311.1 hypothetical protein [Clostridioides difficile]MCP8330919.1 hypothetical protein [Clostridioides difficile]
MIELIQRLNDIIYKINDKLNIHTKLVDPSSEFMPLYSMLSIIVSIFLIILGIKVRKKFLIVIAIISIIINILIILDR